MFECIALTIFFCVFLSLLSGHCSLLVEVSFVAHEQHHDVAVRMLPQLPEPPIDALESVALGDVVHQKSTHSIPIISIGDGSITFLSCSVPNLRSYE